MEFDALMATLRERDVHLALDEDRLKLSAPPGAIDNLLRAAITSRKPEILAYIRRAAAFQNSDSTLVPVKGKGNRPPLFALTALGADAHYMLGLARALHEDQPVVSVEPKGLDGSEPFHTLEALARFQIEKMRLACPDGPYLLTGHCTGGLLAFEVARQLCAAGQTVAWLALIGTPFPYVFKPASRMFFRLSRHARGLLFGSLEDRKRYVRGRLERRKRVEAVARETGKPAQEAKTRVEAATLAAVQRYQPTLYGGRLDLFITSDEWRQGHPWRSMAATVREYDLSRYTRDELLLGAGLPTLAEPYRQALQSITWP